MWRVFLLGILSFFSLQVHGQVRMHVMNAPSPCSEYEAPAFQIPLTHIGHINNPPDGWGQGSVPYEYLMQSTEVSNTQYVAFLNAIASQSDPFELYDPRMATSVDGGILRGRENGRYIYCPRPHFENKPVNFVSWLGAARFVNWLENGQPSGLQGVGTTETGVYDLTAGPSTYFWIQRNPQSLWFLPNGDEWFKAGHYDPSVTRWPNPGYWIYPCKTDSPPPSGTASSSGVFSGPQGSINWHGTANWNGSSIGNVTNIGSSGKNHFGLKDMAGNVAEWTEEIFWGDLGRVIRGGYYASQAAGAGIPNMTPIPVDDTESMRAGFIGFRVARYDYD